MLRYLLIPYLFLLVFHTAFAQSPATEIPDRPLPKKLVNDFAGILTEPKRTEALEYKLAKLNDSLGIELFLVTVKSIKSVDVDAYASMVADKWETTEEKENSIFILYDNDDREYAIVPGSSHEKKFDHYIDKKIESTYMVPFFKKKKYYDGLNATADAIANHITGKLTATELKTNEKFSIYPIALGVFIFFLFLFPIYQYNQFKKHHFGTKKVEFISAFMLMSHLRPSDSKYEDFQKGKGEFSITGSDITSYGGGAGGSWGGW